MTAVRQMQRRENRAVPIAGPMAHNLLKSYLDLASALAPWAGGGSGSASSISTSASSGASLPGSGSTATSGAASTMTTSSAGSTPLPPPAPSAAFFSAAALRKARRISPSRSTSSPPRHSCVLLAILSLVGVDDTFFFENLAPPSSAPSSGGGGLERSIWEAGTPGRESREGGGRPAALAAAMRALRWRRKAVWCSKMRRIRIQNAKAKYHGESSRATISLTLGPPDPVLLSLSMSSRTSSSEKAAR